MIITLQERKKNLLGQIGKLKMEIDIMNWPEHKELALLRCTGSTRYLDFDRLQEVSEN